VFHNTEQLERKIALLAIFAGESFHIPEYKAT